MYQTLDWPKPRIFPALANFSEVDLVLMIWRMVEGLPNTERQWQTRTSGSDMEVEEGKGVGGWEGKIEEKDGVVG